MNSQRPLPQKILSQALHNPSIAVDQYDIIFQRFEKVLAQISPGSSGMCLDAMEVLLKSYPISLGFDSKYCITAKVFTTALACDAILSDTKFIAGDLRSIVNKKMTTCQKNNCRFSFPYLLEILLNPPYRLLEKMLDHCSDEIYGGSVNLKEEWRQKTAAYTEKTAHKTWTALKLNDIDLFRHARLLAYSTQTTPNRIAGELEACKALVRCDESATIALLKNEIGILWEPERWDALADKCYASLYKTTF